MEDLWKSKTLKAVVVHIKKNKNPIVHCDIGLLNCHFRYEIKTPPI